MEVGLGRGVCLVEGFGGSGGVSLVAAFPAREVVRSRLVARLFAGTVWRAGCVSNNTSSRGLAASACVAFGVRETPCRLPSGACSRRSYLLRFGDASAIRAVG